MEYIDGQPKWPLHCKMYVCFLQPSNQSSSADKPTQKKPSPGIAGMFAASGKKKESESKLTKPSPEKSNGEQKAVNDNSSKVKEVVRSMVYLMQEPLNVTQLSTTRAQWVILSLEPKGSGFNPRCSTYLVI